MRIKRRTFNQLAVAGAATGFAGAANAQAKPITVGFGMALTGGLAPNGKAALLAMQIATEEINAKGGILGRPVKLVYYDDQSNPSTVPGLYTKLMDVDKVDIVVSGYATNMIAPAMPVVMQKDRTFFALFGLDVNSEFKYNRYFSIQPAGGPKPKEAFAEGFFEVAMAQNPKPATLAMIGADAEFKPKIYGGGMVGLQATAIKTQLGPLLNDIVVYDFWLPWAGFATDAGREFVKKYQTKSAEAGVDLLGYYLPPFGYALMQVVDQAVTGAGSTDDAKLADFMRKATFKTIVGDFKFNAGGEWETAQVMAVQFQGVQGNGVEQFTNPKTEVILWPTKYKTGDIVYPYNPKK
ncbi:MAG: ABC transporter substrate-binding protein [Rhodospirillales bacterium]|nr:ABC transporter substrate-binding protein [Rhodospirillales bacterium]